MTRIPGSHEPNCKNRSSKHLRWFTGRKSAVRSMSNEMLNRPYDGLMAKEIRREIARRNNKKAKR